MESTSQQTERHARKVLVLGSDERSFLAVIRSLGRKGCEVHVAWCDPDERALRSRYVTQFHELAQPESLSAETREGVEIAWLKDLLALAQTHSFDLVLPTNDPAVVALQSQRDRLSTVVPVYQLNRRAFEVTYDKRATSELARELDIPTPDEVLIECELNADALLHSLGTPLVLKPRRSFAFGRRKWEHQVRKAHDAREVAISLRALLQAGDVLAQRNVPGVGVGVEVLAQAGRILLAFQHRRLHEPLHGGGSSYRKSEAIDPELLEATRKLCAALDYDGVGMFEFKCDEKSGHWWLIEINGRFWGSLPLTLCSGADFPWALVQLCTTGSVDAQADYRHGVTCRNLSMDWPWLWRNLKADRDDAALATVSLRRLIAEGWRALTLREHCDSFSLDDRAPAWAELRTIEADLRQILMKKLRGLPYRVEALRALLTTRLRRRASESARLLFVCKGNICRSPFAEHYARKVLPAHFEIASSGTYPFADRTCPAEAVEAARAFDIRLERHRSRILDASDVKRADLVLVFDEANLVRVSDDFPEAKDKLYRLGALCPTGSIELRDPYGGDLAAFETAYNDIARALDVVVELVAVRGAQAVEEPPL